MTLLYSEGLWESVWVPFLNFHIGLRYLPVLIVFHSTHAKQAQASARLQAAHAKNILVNDFSTGWANLSTVLRVVRYRIMSLDNAAARVNDPALRLFTRVFYSLFSVFCQMFSDSHQLSAGEYRIQRYPIRNYLRQAWLSKLFQPDIQERLNLSNSLKVYLGQITTVSRKGAEWSISQSLKSALISNWLFKGFNFDDFEVNSKEEDIYLVFFRDERRGKEG